MRTGSIGSQQFTSSGVRGSSVTVSGNRDNAGTADERRTTRLQQPTTGVVEAAGVEELGTGSLPTSNLQEASRPSSRVAAETYAQTAASNSMSVSVTRTASSGTPADGGGRPHGYWKPRWHPQAQGWTPHATHKDACTLADDLH